MFLPGAFLGWLIFYLVTTLAYSLALKRIVILDVVILSALYTLRMLAGAAASQTFISPWLAAFAIFIFLSLAMVKRFSELQNVRSAGTQMSGANISDPPGAHGTTVPSISTCDGGVPQSTYPVALSDAVMPHTFSE